MKLKLKTFVPILVCLICIVCAVGAIFAAGTPWDMNGKWLIEGHGYVDKNSIRVQLALDGFVDIVTSDDLYVATIEQLIELSPDVLELVSPDHVNFDTGLVSVDYKVITEYTVNLDLSASGLGISAWDDHINETLHHAIPLPEICPTANKPFDKIPAIPIKDLTYKIIIDSEYSGTVRITGYIRDVDIVGDIELNSESIIWKEGTDKPDYEDMSSGCNASLTGGLGFTILASLAFWGLTKKSEKH